jgi:hypothetical protein
MQAKPQAKMMYWAAQNADPETRAPDVIVEKVDHDSIGISTSEDGAIKYFSPREAILIATALMAMVEED